MERYCITLLQAKRLVELGFDQGSDYFWLEEKAYPDNAILMEDEEIPIGVDAPAFNVYMAYHVGELGEILPQVIKHSGESWALGFDRIGLRWAYYYQQFDQDSAYVEASTEAEARGALLIYLLENKLI